MSGKISNTLEKIEETKREIKEEVGKIGKLLDVGGEMIRLKQQLEALEKTGKVVDLAKTARDEYERLFEIAKKEAQNVVEDFAKGYVHSGHVNDYGTYRARCKINVERGADKISWSVTTPKDIDDLSVSVREDTPETRTGMIPVPEWVKKAYFELEVKQPAVVAPKKENGAPILKYLKVEGTDIVLPLTNGDCPNCGEDSYNNAFQTDQFLYVFDSDPKSCKEYHLNECKCRQFYLKGGGGRWTPSEDKKSKFKFLREVEK